MLAVIIRLCDFVPTLKEIVLEEERKHAHKYLCFKAEGMKAMKEPQNVLMCMLWKEPIGWDMAITS